MKGLPNSCTFPRLSETQPESDTQESRTFRSPAPHNGNPRASTPKGKVPLPKKYGSKFKGRRNENEGDDDDDGPEDREDFSDGDDVDDDGGNDRGAPTTSSTSTNAATGDAEMRVE